MPSWGIPGIGSPSLLKKKNQRGWKTPLCKAATWDKQAGVFLNSRGGSRSISRMEKGKLLRPSLREPESKRPFSFPGSENKPVSSSFCSTEADSSGNLCQPPPLCPRQASPFRPGVFLLGLSDSFGGLLPPPIHRPFPPPPHTHTFSPAASRCCEQQPKQPTLW